MGTRRSVAVGESVNLKYLRPCVNTCCSYGEVPKKRIRIYKVRTFAKSVSGDGDNEKSNHPSSPTGCCCFWSRSRRLQQLCHQWRQVPMSSHSDHGRCWGG